MHMAKCPLSKGTSSLYYQAEFILSHSVMVAHLSVSLQMTACFTSRMKAFTYWTSSGVAQNKLTHDEVINLIMYISIMLTAISLGVIWITYSALVYARSAKIHLHST